MDGSPFYYGKVTDPSGGTALIFLSTALLVALRNVKKVHGDATFKTVPALFYQLFTLHLTAYGKVITHLTFF